MTKGKRRAACRRGGGRGEGTRLVFASRGGWRGFAVAPAMALAVALATLSGPARAQNVAQDTTQDGAGAPAADPASVSAEDGAEAQIDRDLSALFAAAEQVVVPNRVMLLLQSQDPRSNEAIAEFLATGNPAPREVAARAVALSQAARANPALSRGGRLDSVLGGIERAVSNTLGAPRVMAVSMDNDYVPPEGSIAYDFGEADAPVPTGFQRLTQSSPEVFGTNLVLRTFLGDGEVLGNAMEGISNLRLEVPNGSYRVILLTAPASENQASQPFGATFGVNGVSHRLGDATSDAWLETARLQGRTGADPAVPVGGRGGAITVEVDVLDGVLQFDFDIGSTGVQTVLSGLIVEPRAAPTSLQIDDAIAQQMPPLEQVLELELLTQVALRGDLAPAAGPGATSAQATAEAVPQAGPAVPGQATQPQTAQRQRQAAFGRAIIRSAARSRPPQTFDSEVGVSPTTPVSQ